MRSKYNVAKEGTIIEVAVAELEQLSDGPDSEANLAASRIGQGALPSSFFESHSAFAYIDGEVVIEVLRGLWNGPMYGV